MSHSHVTEAVLTVLCRRCACARCGCGRRGQAPWTNGVGTCGVSTRGVGTCGVDGTYSVLAPQPHSAQPPAAPGSWRPHALHVGQARAPAVDRSNTRVWRVPCECGGREGAGREYVAGKQSRTWVGDSAHVKAVTMTANVWSV
eukprot:350879-Chlamydomonas_euryale.AAC.2